MNCYGYDRNTSPQLCGVAEDGILFEDAYSHGTFTPMSIPILLASAPPNLGLPEWGYEFSEEHKTVAEALNKAGYKTILVDEKGGEELELLKDHGLARDFDTVFNSLEEVDTESIEEPFFLFILSEITYPFIPPDDEYRVWANISYEDSVLTEVVFDGTHSEKVAKNVDTIRDLYDERILENDARIGRFIENLKEENMYDDTLIVVSSDHGEAFGERKELKTDSLFFGHGNQVPHEEHVRTPLIIKFPDNKWSGEVVEYPVGNVDIVPTIYDYLDIETKHDTFGSSLMPIIQDEEEVSEVVLASHPSIRWGLRSEQYKYILTNVHGHCWEGKSPEIQYLYNLEEDRDEKNNLIDEKPELATNLKERLCQIYIKGEIYADDSRKIEMGSEKEERLEDMGYLQ